MRRRQGLKLTIAVGTAFAAIAAPAGAATFEPTTFADDTTVDPQHCVSPVAGEECSLREAVRAANDAATNDEVVLKAGTYEMNPFNDIEIVAGVADNPSGTLVIRGTGQTTTTVDGNGSAADETRVFTFDRFVNAELRDLGITGGFGNGSSNGGAIKVRDGSTPRKTQTSRSRACGCSATRCRTTAARSRTAASSCSTRASSAATPRATAAEASKTTTS